MDNIIFDLDGTLWDSTSTVIDSWNKTLDKYAEVTNRLKADDFKRIMGLVIADIAKVFFPYIEEPKRITIMKDCCVSECKYLEEHGAILYDNLEVTLKELSKKYKLFIVSSCQSAYLDAFFKFHNLGKYFTDHETHGRTGLTKGENIKLVIERNNLKNSIYVGDTEGDLKSARFAGIPFIYARYGFGQVDEYDYVIDRFCDILNLNLSL